MRSWKHSGFSVNKNVLIKAGDTVGLERLVQYISRCPFSLERIIKLTDTDHVIYKAEHKNCRRFPDPANETLKPGVNRNFQIFNPLDFIAEITQHIPNKGEHTIRYYGFYSNKPEEFGAKLSVVNQPNLRTSQIRGQWRLLRRIPRIVKPCVQDGRP
jgi:Putative transposase.